MPMRFFTSTSLRVYNGGVNPVPVSPRSRATRAATPATAASPPPLPSLPRRRQSRAAVRTAAAGPSFSLAPLPDGWSSEGERMEGRRRGSSVPPAAGGDESDAGGSGPRVARSGGSSAGRVVSKAGRGGRATGGGGRDASGGGCGAGERGRRGDDGGVEGRRRR